MNNKLIAVLGLLSTVPFTVIAGEAEDELIAKVTQAYGGDALLNMSNYRIEERYISPTGGQGHRAGLVEIGKSAQVLTVDLKNNKAVYDSWNFGRQGGSQYATVSDGEKAQNINYMAGTYGDAQNADPHVFAGGTMRTTDTVLVYELNRAKAEAKLAEDTRYMNRPHHLISMPFPSSPDLQLFIDSETFLVSRMLRVNPQLGNLDYVFSNHKKHNGISYASNIDFFIAGNPNLIGTQHDVTFNLDLPADTFTLASNLKPESERIDASNMMVNKISDRAYHVGQSGAFTLFVDTSMGTIAAGGYAGLQGRFEHFQTESNKYKPLTYQVVTHHHNDHIGGVAEGIALGAKLVTVEENVQEIKNGTTPTPKDRNFHTIKSRATFGDGRDRVEVYEVSTIHAASFLVTYVPAAKTVFIADHMGSPYAKGTPVANQSTVDMLAALEALNIDIAKIATAHNARIFSMQDMRASVAAYKPNICAGDRPICL